MTGREVKIGSILALAFVLAVGSGFVFNPLIAVLSTLAVSLPIVLFYRDQKVRRNFSSFIERAKQSDNLIHVRGDGFQKSARLKSVFDFGSVVAHLRPKKKNTCVFNKVEVHLHDPIFGEDRFVESYSVLPVDFDQDLSSFREEMLKKARSAVFLSKKGEFIRHHLLNRPEEDFRLPARMETSNSLEFRVDVCYEHTEEMIIDRTCWLDAPSFMSVLNQRDLENSEG